ncbi:MAG: hypothetical protein IJ833_06400 [Lachnospiraceae bacterium]|nr:hypothetical protein [Lachnospiraceae bacterium]
MEYLVFGLTLVGLILIVFIREAYLGKKREKEFVRSLYEDYGKEPKRELTSERLKKVGSYYQRHLEPGQVDDITWNDLSMDEVFKQMNHTLSATGEEYLYYTLRNTVKTRQELNSLERLIVYFSEHEEERVKVQLLMNRLGFVGKYSLYDYLDQLDYLGSRSNRKHLVADVLFLPLIGLLFVDVPMALLGMAVLIVYNITTYFGEKKLIDPYIVSFSYIMRLLNTAEAFCKLNISVCEAQTKTLTEQVNALKDVRKGAFWVMWQTTGNPSDVLGVIMDYLRMIFHTDIIVFNRMLACVKEHIAEIDVVIGQLGYVETAIAIGAYRRSMKNGYCVPKLVEKGSLEIQAAYHPLIKEPVKNSIRVERGVLLTGSNASGKSTFLRTVALNAIMAQTIHTCAADTYSGMLYRIYSSMSLKDDLESGESYYMVEIKALKRILDTATSYEGSVLCFVDEVLRGTNTVERIAASTQILKSLAGSNLICFAATHDIEMTRLLEQDYDNYHFEEDVRDGDILFDYRLLPGRATGRNAIKLLEIMGYDANIVQEASRLAGKFMETGQWV